MKSHRTHVGTPYRSIRHGTNHAEVEHSVPERAVEGSLHAQPTPDRPLEPAPAESRINVSPAHEAEERIGLRGHGAAVSRDAPKRATAEAELQQRERSGGPLK